MKILGTDTTHKRHTSKDAPFYSSRQATSNRYLGAGNFNTSSSIDPKQLKQVHITY
jgi:hypothetical protein